MSRHRKESYLVMATNNLKKILTKEGISQVELAKESTLSDGTINKICNQKRTPAPTSMFRILNALNKLLEKEKYQITDLFPNYKGDGDDEEED